VFANVVLADEINRATPKTQSALLEAMSEGQVTIERKRFLLPEPFLVIATQNPLEHQGTFPLPESQLDRFLMSLQIGYPPAREERELLLSGGVQAILEELSAVVDRDELVALQHTAQGVTVSEKLASYVLDLAEATRQGADFLLGVSTRGAQGLFRAVQALALCEGRRFAVPDDVQRLAVPVLSHRVVLRHGGLGSDATRAAIERVVASRPVPL
jgi:MoxR-like ATPase